MIVFLMFIFANMSASAFQTQYAFDQSLQREKEEIMITVYTRSGQCYAGGWNIAGMNITRTKSFKRGFMEAAQKLEEKGAGHSDFFEYFMQIVKTCNGTGPNFSDCGVHSPPLSSGVSDVEDDLVWASKFSGKNVRGAELNGLFEVVRLVAPGFGGAVSGFGVAGSNKRMHY